MEQDSQLPEHNVEADIPFSPEQHPDPLSQISPSPTKYTHRNDGVNQLSDSAESQPMDSFTSRVAESQYVETEEDTQPESLDNNDSQLSMPPQREIRPETKRFELPKFDLGLDEGFKMGAFKLSQATYSRAFPGGPAAPTIQPQKAEAAPREDNRQQVSQPQQPSVPSASEPSLPSAPRENVRQRFTESQPLQASVPSEPPPPSAPREDNRQQVSQAQHPFVPSASEPSLLSAPRENGRQRFTKSQPLEATVPAEPSLPFAPRESNRQQFSQAQQSSMISESTLPPMPPSMPSRGASSSFEPARMSGVSQQFPQPSGSRASSGRALPAGSGMQNPAQPPVSSKKANPIEERTMNPREPRVSSKKAIPVAPMQSSREPRMPSQKAVPVQESVESQSSIPASSHRNVETLEATKPVPVEQPKRPALANFIVRKKPEGGLRRRYCDKLAGDSPKTEEPVVQPEQLDGSYQGRKHPVTQPEQRERRDGTSQGQKDHATQPERRDETSHGRKKKTKRKHHKTDRKDLQPVVQSVEDADMDGTTLFQEADEQLAPRDKGFGGPLQPLDLQDLDQRLNQMAAHNTDPDMDENVPQHMGPDMHEEMHQYMDAEMDQEMHQYMGPELGQEVHQEVLGNDMSQAFYGDPPASQNPKKAHFRGVPFPDVVDSSPRAQNLRQKRASSYVRSEGGMLHSSRVQHDAARINGAPHQSNLSSRPPSRMSQASAALNRPLRETPNKTPAPVHRKVAGDGHGRVSKSQPDRSRQREAPPVPLFAMGAGPLNGPLASQVFEHAAQLARQEQQALEAEKAASQNKDEQIAQLSGDKDGLVRQVNDLEIDNANMNRAIDRLAKRASKYKVHMNEVVDCQKGLLETGTAWKKKLETLQADMARDATADFEKKKQVVMQQVEKVRVKNGEMREEMRNARQALVDHERTIQVLKNDLNKGVIDLQRERGVSALLQKELADQKNAQADLKTLLENHKEQLVAEVSKNQTTLTSLVGTGDSYQAKLDECLSALSSITEQKNGSMSAIEELSKAVKDIMSRAENKSNAADETASSVKEAGLALCEDLRQKLEGIRLDHENQAKLNEQIADLRELNATLNAEVQTGSSNLAQAQSVLEGVQAELAICSEKLATRDRELTDALNAEDPQMRQEINECHSRNTSLQTQLDNARSETRTVTSELQALQDVLSSTREEAAELETRLKEAEEKISLFHAEREEFSAAARADGEKIAGLEGENQTLQARLTAKESRYEGLLAALRKGKAEAETKLQNEIENRQNREADEAQYNNEQLAELNLAQEKIRSLEEKQISVESQLQLLRTDLQSQKQKVTSKERELERRTLEAREELDRAVQQANADATHEINTIKDRRDRTQVELNESKAQMDQNKNLLASIIAKLQLTNAIDENGSVDEWLKKPPPMAVETRDIGVQSLPPTVIETEDKGVQVTPRKKVQIEDRGVQFTPNRVPSTEDKGTQMTPRKKVQIEDRGVQYTPNKVRVTAEKGVGMTPRKKVQIEDRGVQFTPSKAGVTKDQRFQIEEATNARMSVAAPQKAPLRHTYGTREPSSEMGRDSMPHARPQLVRPTPGHRAIPVVARRGSRDSQSKDQFAQPAQPYHPEEIPDSYQFGQPSQPYLPDEISDSFPQAEAATSYGHVSRRMSSDSLAPQQSGPRDFAVPKRLMEDSFEPQPKRQRLSERDPRDEYGFPGRGPVQQSTQKRPRIDQLRGNKQSSSNKQSAPPPRGVEIISSPKEPDSPFTDMEDVVENMDKQDRRGLDSALSRQRRAKSSETEEVGQAPFSSRQANLPRSLGIEEEALRRREARPKKSILKQSRAEPTLGEPEPGTSQTLAASSQARAQANVQPTPAASGGRERPSKQPTQPSQAPGILSKGVSGQPTASSTGGKPATRSSTKVYPPLRMRGQPKPQRQRTA